MYSYKFIFLINSLPSSYYVRKTQAIAFLHNFYVFASNYLLVSLERNFPTPGLNIDLCRKKISLQLKFLFITYSIRGTIKLKQCLSMYMGSPLVSSFNERCIGFQEVYPLTTVHTIDSDILDSLTTDRE